MNRPSLTKGKAETACGGLNCKEFLLKKAISLLLPCFVLPILDRLYYIILISIENNIFELNIVQLFQIMLTNFDLSFWFLTNLFGSYFMIYVGYKILKKGYLVNIASIVFVLTVPFCAIQRYLLPFFLCPFFLMGIFLKDNYEFITKHIRKILYGSLVIFGVCLYFWDGNYTIYVTAFPHLFDIKTLEFNFTNINISLFRLLIGGIGSIFFFALFQNIYRENAFCSKVNQIGKYTLGIYILQTYILEKDIAALIDFPTMNVWLYSLIVTPLTGLLVLIICIGIMKIIHRFKYIEFLLF